MTPTLSRSQLESRLSEISKQLVRLTRRPGLRLLESFPVHDIEILITVAVVIEKRYARTGRRGDDFLRLASEMIRTGQPELRGHVSVAGKIVFVTCRGGEGVKNEEDRAKTPHRAALYLGGARGTP